MKAKDGYTTLDIEIVEVQIEKCYAIMNESLKEQDGYWN